jgi:hypothetical protein
LHPGIIANETGRSPPPEGPARRPHHRNQCINFRT